MFSEDQFNVTFNEFFHTTLDAFCVIDSDWQLIYFNRAAEKYLSEKHNELMGAKLWNVIHDHILAEQLHEKYMQDINKCDRICYETQMVNSSVWVKVTISLIRSNKLLVVSIFDISEYKKAEGKWLKPNYVLEQQTKDKLEELQNVNKELRNEFEEWKQKKEALEALMNHNPSLVFMKDEQGRYVYINKSYEEQFVHTNDWYGKTDFDFWPKESAELFRANDYDVLKSGRIHQFVEDSTDIEGIRYCWLCYKFSFVNSKGAKYLGGIGINATKLIQAEEELRRSEKRQASLLKLSDVLKVTNDPTELKVSACSILSKHLGVDLVLCRSLFPDGRKVSVPAEYTTDYSKEGIGCLGDICLLGDYNNMELELCDKGTVVIDNIENSEIINEALYSVYKALGVCALIIVPLTHIGEVVITMNVLSSVPRKWRQDEVTLVEDVLNRTWATVECLKKDNSIKQQQESIINLQREKNQALQREMDMKDEFLSLISHEFKTPLTVINSALQMLNTFYNKDLPNKAKEYLVKIQQNSNRQLKLINNLLDITRINSGGLKLNETAIEIVSFTKVITESIRVYAEQNGIELSFSSTLKKKVIVLDDEKYERILLNLLSNAIKYTPRGKSMSVKLCLKIANRKQEICLVVQDRGIGITPDKQEIIFEKFGQVDSSLSRQAEGTGIGLYLAKLLVEMLGGKIILESEKDKGSKFIVLIPIKKEYKEDNALLAHIMPQEAPDSRLIRSTIIEFSDIHIKEH